MALNPGDILQGRFKIEALLGTGGFGSVYRAFHEELDKALAIKSFTAGASSEQGVAMEEVFRNEARTLMGLEHPNLPKVYDLFSVNGTYFLIMDLVHGETLEELANKAHPIAEERLLQWAHQLAGVLGYLHTRTPAVVFRDLKPPNVMIQPDETVKLIDFGVSKRMATPTGGGTHHIIHCTGTEGFSPPEQYNWQSTTDPRSDMYALGATLYCIASNTLPCDSTRLQAELAILPPLAKLRPDLSSGFISLVEHMMELDPELRPGSAKEVQLRIEQLMDSKARVLSEPSGQERMFVGRYRGGPFNGIARNYSVEQASPPEQANAVPIPPYELRAAAGKPALVIYLIDLSGSMENPLDGGTAGHEMSLAAGADLADFRGFCQDLRRLLGRDADFSGDDQSLLQEWWDRHGPFSTLWVEHALDSVSRSRQKGIRLIDYCRALVRTRNRRIDVVNTALHHALRSMLSRSTRSGPISSRYRVAIFGYSDQPRDFLNGIRSIEEIALKINKLPDLTTFDTTDTYKAFRAAEDLLLDELPSQQDKPVPVVCHITDGMFNGEDPEPVAHRIKQMQVRNGNVLVENIYISENVIDLPQNIKEWPGISNATQLKSDYAEKLRHMSSPMPGSYRRMFLERGFHRIEENAVMMLPGTSSDMVELGIQLSQYSA